MMGPSETAFAVRLTEAPPGASRYVKPPRLPPGASSVISSVEPPVTVTSPMPGAGDRRAGADRTATGVAARTTTG